MANPYLIAAVFLFLYMNVGFVASLVLKRNDIADVAWGFGFVLLTAVMITQNPAAGLKAGVAQVLVLAWGARLSLFILKRNHGKPDDARYAKMRAGWGQHVVLKSYFYVFMLQGLFLYVICLPLIHAALSPAQGASPLLILGALIAAVGILLEAIADHQKSLFKRNPENRQRFTNIGLWK